MRAIEQIDDKMYAIEFEDTYDEALCYGISFFKKRCIVMKKQHHKTTCKGSITYL